MKSVEEIAGMVTIRNHLQTLRDRSLIKRSDYQTVNNLILELDQDIIDSSLQLFKQQSKVQVEDPLNIQKKIAEARAKLQQERKASPEDKASSLDRPRRTVEDEDKLPEVVERPRPSFKKKSAAKVSSASPKPKLLKTEAEKS